MKTAGNTVTETAPAMRSILWLADAAGEAMPATREYAQKVERSLLVLGLQPSDFDGYRPHLNRVKPDLQYICALVNDPFFQTQTAEVATRNH